MEKYFDEVHTPRNPERSYRKVQAYGNADIYSADLIDLSRFAEYNDNYKWILSLIDIISRKGIAIPLKNKLATTVLKGYKQIVEGLGKQPNKLWTDQGKEFYNKTFKKYLSKHNTHLYSTFSGKKAVVVERFNRTILTKLFKSMAKNKTRRWIDLLTDVIVSYNNTEHSTIKMTPNELWEKEKDFQPSIKRHQKSPIKFKKGDIVRVMYPKKTFDKGYLPNWSWDVFKINKVFLTNPTTYTLTNGEKKKLEGKYYDWQLKKTVQPFGVYNIERVVDTEMKDGIEYSFVKWVGYDASHNSWIPTNQLID